MKKVELLGLSVVAAALIMTTGCSSDSDDSSAGVAGGVAVGLYGTLGNESGTSDFVKLNATTGEVIETVGNVGYLVNGLEYDATTNTFFATTSENDVICSACLITINPADGNGTEIGSSVLGNLLNPTVNSAGDLYGWTENSDDLVTINKETGEATVVGSSGISSYTHGLAFDANDVLWMYNGDNSVYEMNTTSGASEFLVDSLGSDTAHHGDFNLDTGTYAGINNYARDNRAVVFKDSDFNTTSTSEHNYTNLHTLTFVN